MTKISGVSYAGKPVDHTAMYITKKVEHLVANLNASRGCMVFVEDTVNVPVSVAQNNEIIRTKTPQRDYVQFVSEMAEEIRKREDQRKYTLTAGGYYLGENVTIGEGAVIEPGCLIGHDVVIGKNARIKCGAKIRNAVIGDDLIICENATVGTTGFTMAEDGQGNKIRIPTLGKVVAGNGLEVGALSNISCGSAGNTSLGNYVKLDSLVYIGHDVTVGDNVEFPAGVTVGGFVTIGDGAYIGVGSVLRNRICIGQKAFVGMGAVVTKSVEDGITVVGNPAHPFERRK